MKLLQKVSFSTRTGRTAATAELSHSIQTILKDYRGIEEMIPEAMIIAGKLSCLVKSGSAQVFKTAQNACQKHFHQLMLDSLHDYDGELEQNPEARRVVRAIFQLSILHNSSMGGLASQRLAS